MIEQVALISIGVILQTAAFFTGVFVGLSTRKNT